MEIKTLGDFRRITKDLNDDFKLYIRIMKKVPEEELIKRGYPYPWDMIDGRMEFQDVGVADKDICIGIYEKED